MKSLQEHINQVEKEFERYFWYQELTQDAKERISAKLREVATATLAACDVEEKLLNGGLDKPEDGWYGGWNAAVVEQKKKAEEWMI